MERKKGKNAAGLIFRENNHLTKAASANITVTDNNQTVIFSGYYGYALSNQGAHGHLWSSTVSSATYAHFLFFYLANVLPTSYYDKYGGFAVRCVR